MTLKLSHLVSLLQSLDANRAKKAITRPQHLNPDHQTVNQWFETHKRLISHQGPEALALLNCLFPERLAQRNYNARETRLAHIFSRAMCLGHSRAARLQAWREQDGVDFAECVESVMAETEFAACESPTLVELDAALLSLAAISPYSSPKVRASADARSMQDILEPIIKRLRSREAKWFVRMVLKRYGPVQMPEIALARFHFLLPHVLATQNDMEAALVVLGREEIARWPCNPDPTHARALKAAAATVFEPRMGVMVARQAYDKARSIKHCVDLANERVMSVERKYDGEYCQIHVTRAPEKDEIQIFAKSGRDSTDDRYALLGAIKRGLDLDGEGCKIQYRCILEGELVVWNRLKRAIEPFHKIRRYVRHGGKYLGAERDSPRKPEEQPMIIFYDVLLLDDKLLAKESHEVRRRHLKGLVHCLSGVSDTVERKLIDFSYNSTPKRCMRQLRDRFATCVQQRWEGLVLKCRDDPYLDWVRPPRGIKLKKDYLRQLGDSADLCIVGARNDSRLQAVDGWNQFYLACLDNREEVQRFGAKPAFKIIDTISAGTSSIPPEDLSELNRVGHLETVQWTNDHLSVKMLIPSERPDVLFKKPFVVECLGSGYDKNSSCTFWTLRFPRLTKIHHDRGVDQTCSFAELQAAAHDSMSVSDEDDAEIQQWIKKLIEADGKKAALMDKSQSTSPGKTPRSAATASLSPVSARKPPPPALVRTDTAELTALELHQRRAHSQTTATSSTRTPSSAASKQHSAPQRLPTIAEASMLESPPPSSPSLATASRGKRRAEDVSEECSPNKRRPLPGGLIKSPAAVQIQIDLMGDPQSSAPPAIQRAMRASANSSTKVKVSRKPRGLLKTPPWCRSLATSSSPTEGPRECTLQRSPSSYECPPREASARRPVQPSVRRASNTARAPLGELPDRSSQRSSTDDTSANQAQVLKASRKLANALDGVQRRDFAGPALQELHALSVEGDPCIVLREESLLTPPSTEEAARKEASATPRADSPRAIDEVLESPTDRVRQQADRKCIGEFTNDWSRQLILISPSVTKKAQCSACLPNSKAVFTYSRETFSDHVRDWPEVAHIYVVNSADATEAARDLLALAKDILTNMKTVARALEGNITIQVCDWNILEHLGQFDLARRWKEHNICSIEFGYDDTTDIRRLRARMLW